MSFRNWVRSWNRTQAPKTSRRPTLRMEPLEDRITPATRTWDGGAGANTNWSAAANWVGGVVPVNNDNIVFPAGVQSNMNIPGLIVTQIAFNAGDSTVNLVNTLGFNGNGGFTDQITSATGTTNRFIGAGSMALSGANFWVTIGGTVSIANDISGPFGIRKAGAGQLFLGGANNTYTGLTTVDVGILQPGTRDTPGITTAPAGVQFNNGSTFQVALDGQTVFDRLNVNGTVTINAGANLVVQTPVTGTGPFTIINNDGTDAVTGTFAGLPEGAAVPGTRFTISYVGGTGNDVVLTSPGGNLMPLLVTGPTNSSGQIFIQGAPGKYNTTPAGLISDPIPGFVGEVRVALGDVNGDGLIDAVVATGPGGNRVRVFDNNGTTILADFNVFAAPFSGGLYVAVGDLNADGKADIAVTGDGVDAFSGPVANGLGVRVYDGNTMVGATTAPTVMASFNGLASLSGAQGEGALVRLGGRPSIADVNRDGLPDLLIAAGNGGGPRICVWNGTGFAGAAGGNPTTNPIANLFVFESTQRGGAFVTSGDLNGDGFADIAVGGGPGGGPRVRVVNSNLLLGLPNLEGVNLDDPANLANGLVLNNFFAGDANNRGGVRVAFRDLEQDGFADLVTGSGTNEQSSLRIYGAASLTAAFGTSSEPASPQVFDPFGVTLPGGVWIG